MVAEKNTTTGLEVADLPTMRSDNEKSAAIYTDHSDNSSSGVGDYDDLPDPDAGKSDEERARLVSCSCSDVLLSSC
jgi:hypothetical protein